MHLFILTWCLKPQFRFGYSVLEVWVPQMETINDTWRLRSTTVTWNAKFAHLKILWQLISVKKKKLHLISAIKSCAVMYFFFQMRYSYCFIYKIGMCFLLVFQWNFKAFDISVQPGDTCLLSCLQHRSVQYQSTLVNKWLAHSQHDPPTLYGNTKILLTIMLSTSISLSKRYAVFTSIWIWWHHILNL